MSDLAPDTGRPTRTRGWWVRLVVVGVLLPLLAASILVWSVSDREQALDKIPVAVVNNDKILSDPQPMAAGRALTASLTDPSTSSPNLDWKLTDTDDAKSGLSSGAYYAVLTIPSDFSSAIVSSGTDKPVRGQLTLVSNQAASATVPYISEQIAAAAATSLGNQTTQGYLKNVYDGFNQIAKSNSSAASSASQLATGTDELSQGATQLDDGTNTLAGSLDEVASGSADLHDGTQTVASGAAEVATGASGVAGGAAKLKKGTATLARSSARLSTRSSDYSAKSKQVARAADGLSTATGRLATGTRGLAGDVGQLAAQCAAAGGSVPFCAELTRARNRSIEVAGGSGLVHRAAGGLARADNALATGAEALADGNKEVARGVQKLSGASASLSKGANKVSSGASSVARGARSVSAAAGNLEGGTEKTSAAAASLASGSASLDSSASSVDNGAQQLSSGLEKGAKESPTYSSSQQDALATAVSEPVQLTKTVQHTEHGNGWLLAAIVAVVLWLAALVGALAGDVAAARREALAPVSSRRLVLVQVLPVLGLALVQAAAVVVAVLVFHSSLAAAIPFALLCALAAVSFTLLAHTMRLAWGGAGVTGFVLFLLVQLAATGNVIPLETAPGPLATVNGLMPLTAFTNGASQLIGGGAVQSMFSVVVVLVLWGLAAFAAAVSVVKRRRVLPRTLATSSPTVELVA